MNSCELTASITAIANALACRLTSDGADVGFNPDTTTSHRICYTWQADKEGVFLFSDLADPRSGEDGTNVHGLFGAIIVEAAGSSWFDPVTGDPIDSGLFADVYHPFKPAFREYAVFFHDELEILTKDNQQPVDPHTGLPNGTTAISYRAEPMRNRLPLDHHHADPADTPEHPGSDDDPGVMGINYRCEPMPERLKRKNDPAHIFSSFCYGDPATPILETYPGEPMVIRLFDGAHEEQHVFTLTGLSWRKEITDPVSPLVQTQTIGISEAFNLRVDQPYGAGDYLYYSGGIDDLWLGLWGIIRAYAVPRKDLLPLCGIRPIAAPRTPPPGAVVRKFQIAAIQKDLRYNHFGDHDPDGLLFVPLDQAEEVRRGRRRPIPLILRVNAGDWVEVTLHNLFDHEIPIFWNDYPSVPLDLPHPPGDRVSLHPQFLGYDPVASPGVNVGYNPVEQTAGPGECVRYLWHADREAGACLLTSFGDLRNHRHHGLFGAVIVEPPQAKHYSGVCPMEENHGEEAVIAAPGVETFREFVLFAHNGIRLLMPADKPRSISFTLHGHRWRAQPGDPFSTTIPIQEAVSVGNVFNIEPERTQCPGDYLYRSGSLRWDVESGMWGIYRVLPRGIRYHCETACRNVKQWYEK